MHATIFGNVTALVQRLYGTRKSDHQTKWKKFTCIDVIPSVIDNTKKIANYYESKFAIDERLLTLPDEKLEALKFEYIPEEKI